MDVKALDESNFAKSPAYTVDLTRTIQLLIDFVRQLPACAMPLQNLSTPSLNNRERLLDFHRVTFSSRQLHFREAALNPGFSACAERLGQNRLTFINRFWNPQIAPLS
jgi:hypothetical protein